MLCYGYVEAVSRPRSSKGMGHDATTHQHRGGTATMTQREARQNIGRLVAWHDMDARIDQTKTILEALGAHGIATISYSVEHRVDRYITRQPIASVVLVE